MEPLHSAESRSKTFFAILISLSLLKLFLHLYTNAFAGYGIFRDELYYLACANHLAMGYVDQPPLSVYILWFFRLFIGDSLFAIRAIVAVAGASTIFVAGLIVRRLGGGTIAVLITGTTLLFTPIYQSMNTFYSMNAFDILLWCIAFYMIIKIIQENQLKDWIIFGIIVGLGLLNKISMGWLAVGFAVGLLLSDQRKQLLTIRPYLAGAIAFVIFSPYIIWNVTHDMAHLEFIHNASNNKYGGLQALDFMKNQIPMHNPIAVLFAIAGLIYLFVNKAMRKYIILGVIPIITIIILYVNGHSKPEYLSPVYFPLYAAGAILIERVCKNRWMLWAPFIIVFLLVLYGFITVPLAMPFLPIEDYIEHAQKVGIQEESTEGKDLAELPQFFADMHGWQEMAEHVSLVYHALPDSEKATTIIFGHDYGQAGSMDYYRDKYDLPPVISFHNNYWWWAEDIIDQPITTVIIIGGNNNDHLNSMETVEQAMIHHADYAMPYENNIPIFVARRPKMPFREIWKNHKHYD